MARKSYPMTKAFCYAGPAVKAQAADETLCWLYFRLLNTHHRKASIALHTNMD